MIPSTSIIFATVVLNALSGMGAPIKVTRALAEAHQPGRRTPQPIAADSIIPEAKRSPTDPTSNEHPAIHRRFPRRVHYERYMRELASREPAPEPAAAEPVVERAPAKAESAPHRRHSRRTPKREARSAPSTNNLPQRRNSKVGGSQRRSPATEVEKVAAREVPHQTIPKRSPKVIAKKRSTKGNAPAKKRSTKPKALAKKRAPEDGELAAPTQAKRSRAGTSLTKRSKSNERPSKRSNKAKNMKRSDKKNNLKKRSTVAGSSTPSEVELRALDTPSENLEARHYKIIKIKTSGGGGCRHKRPHHYKESSCGCSDDIDDDDEEIIELPSCSCNCGCADKPPTGPGLPGNPTTGTPGNSTTVETPPIIPGTPLPPVDTTGGSGSGSGSGPGSVIPPVIPPVSGPSSTASSDPTATGMPDKPKRKSKKETAGQDAPVIPPPVVPSVGRRLVKERSPRINAAPSRRHSSRNVMRK